MGWKGMPVSVNEENMKTFRNLLAREEDVRFLDVEMRFCRNALTIRLGCDDPCHLEVREPENSNASIFAADHWELFFRFREREFPLFQMVVDWQGRAEFLQVRLSKKQPKMKPVAIQADIRVEQTPGHAEVILVLNLDQLEGLMPDAPTVPWNICYCPADGSGIYSHVTLPQIDFHLVDSFTPLELSGLAVSDEHYDFDAGLLLKIDKPVRPSPWVTHSVVTAPSAPGAVTVSDHEFAWCCEYTGGNFGYAGIAATVRCSQGECISHHRLLRYVHPNAKAWDLKLEELYLDHNAKVQLRLPVPTDVEPKTVLQLNVHRLNEPDCVLQRQIECDGEVVVSLDIDELPAGCYLLRGDVEKHGEVRPFNDIVFIKGGEAFPFSVISGREYNIDMGGHILGLGYHINPHNRDPQSVIDAINEAGGVAVIAHPDSPTFLFPHELLLRLNGYLGIEINNHEDNPSGNYCGTWDVLLSAGKRVYGFAGDDAHSAAGMGHAYIQVASPSSAPDVLLETVMAGRFYASTGVDITAYERKGTCITISVAEKVRALMLVDGGQVHESAEGTDFKFEIPQSAGYARITLTNETGRSAWFQPEYPDGGDWCCCGVDGWRKVNLHAHSTVSDGAFPPWKTAMLYVKKGYNALAVTDHF